MGTVRLRYEAVPPERTRRMVPLRQSNCAQRPAEYPEAGSRVLLRPPVSNALVAIEGDL